MKPPTLFAVWLAVGVIVQQTNAQAQPRAEEPISVFAPMNSYQRVSLESVEKNFLDCFNCSCDRVIESGIAELARLKLVHLGSGSDDLRRRLKDLSIDGSTPAVRYKAYLAGTVFASPQMFAEDSLTPFSTQEELFQAIARRLDSNLLVAK